MPVPNSFANVTTSIPLSQLDANFNTPITLGNTAIQLGNTVTTLNNMTLANVTVTSGNVTITNVSVTTANVTTANITNLIVSGTGTFAAGSNTAPSITFSGDTNTGIFSPAADTIAFTEGGVESMRIDASGRLLLGTTTAGSNQGLTVYNATQGEIRLQNSTTGNGTADGFQIAVSGSDAFLYNRENANLNFGTNDTERMRIDASGNVGIGQTPTAYGSTVRTVEAYIAGAAGYTLVSAATASVKTEIAAAESSLLGQVGTRTNHPLMFFTNTAEKMRIETSGNVGIGTSSPSFKLDVVGNAKVGNVYGTGLTVTVAGNSITYPTDNTLAFNTNSTERARIDASGNLLVGTTTAVAVLTTSAPSGNNVAAFRSAGAVSTTRFARFDINSSTEVGSIQYNGTGTSYITTSDYRLKEDVEPMTGALAKVQALKPCTYTWKSTGQKDEGFIAHELAEVCPRAVSGEKDAVDEEGNINPQGIDTSFLVATLTAAIQEQQQMIETLQAKVAALEGKK